ncbi:MAG: transcriptional regulator [Candidatus Hodarchaeota archaeon]
MNQENRSPNGNLFGPTIPLSIMLLLHTHQRVKFTVLQKLLETTPGNLDYHLQRLAKAGYVTLTKQLFPRRPHTVITITEQGKTAFQKYVAQFQDILDRIEAED